MNNTSKLILWQWALYMARHKNDRSDKNKVKKVNKRSHCSSPKKLWLRDSKRLTKWRFLETSSRDVYKSRMFLHESKTSTRSCWTFQQSQRQNNSIVMLEDWKHTSWKNCALKIHFSLWIDVRRWKSRNGIPNFQQIGSWVCKSRETHAN